MWGDTDHIKRLKDEQPPWPADPPALDPKKAKQKQQADRAAQKAAEADARALAKWSQMPLAKPAKQPAATTRPTAADLADLKVFPTGVGVNRRPRRAGHANRPYSPRAWG